MTTITTLRALVDVIPDDRLCTLVVQLARNGSAEPAAMPAIAAPVPRRVRRRRGPGTDKPLGRRPGRPRKHLTAAETKAKLAAKAKRYAARRIERRIAAKAAQPGPLSTAAPASVDVVKAPGKAANGNGGHASGHGGAPRKSPAAEKLWDHAKLVDAKCPWRPVADEFELNRQATLDCYRQRALPPGVTSERVEQFLQVAAG
jgi:hypothetical protein